MALRNPDWPVSVCRKKVPTPTPISPSTTSVHRATRTTKRRRVMRGTYGAELEVGADREGKGQAAEEGIFSWRRERGADRALDLLVLAGGVRYGRNPIVRRHAIQRERGETLIDGRRCVEIDRPGRLGERIVPHVGLEGPHRREHANANAGRPFQPVEPQLRRIVRALSDRRLARP